MQSHPTAKDPANKLDSITTTSRRISALKQMLHPASFLSLAWPL
jgi:hypothetical protein